MFLENRTTLSAVCRRASVPFGGEGELRRVAFVATCEAFRIAAGKLEPIEAAPPAPLERMMKAPVLAGISVTLAGTIAPPDRGMLARRVALEVGSERRELVARGVRLWARQGDAIVPGPPGRWEPLAMDWSEAFGGGEDVPARRDRRTGLPAPAYRARHAMNPDGKGFYVNPEGTIGRPVPRLELIDEQLQRFGDLPFPGCFALAPEGSGLHAPTAQMAKGLRADDDRSLAAFGHLVHHVAPSFLVLDGVAPSVLVRTSGMLRDVSFHIPVCRSTVLAKRKARGEQAGTRLRALHVDADRQTVALVWQHVVIATPRGLPDLSLVARTSTKERF